MNKPVILVTGKNGQLGNELQVIAPSFAGFEFVFTDVAELDITDEHAVSDCFDKYRPFGCINAAAYTAVDKAENEQAIAMKVNADAVANLATHCNRYNTRFIHVSTDYVFNGKETAPYREDHPVDPVNYYGFTKLCGEQMCRQQNPGSVVIRTSWVYSRFGHNFVKTMLRLMKEKDQLNVVADQFGSPTYAADLAKAIMDILMFPDWTPGIYHFSNEGSISWFDFAVAIGVMSGSGCRVNPIKTTEYPTPAKRPNYSVLDKNKIMSTYHISLHNWRESLQSCLDLIAG